MGRGLHGGLGLDGTCGLGSSKHGGRGTWHGRWTLFSDLLKDNSLFVPFPWQGHLCLRRCAGYEWNCM